MQTTLNRAADDNSDTIRILNTVWEGRNDHLLPVLQSTVSMNENMKYLIKPSSSVIPLTSASESPAYFAQSVCDAQSQLNINDQSTTVNSSSPSVVHVCFKFLFYYNFRYFL